MSSFNPPAIDPARLASRRQKHRRFPISLAGRPAKDNTPGDARPIPIRSHQAKQPMKQARLLLPGLLSDDLNHSAKACPTTLLLLLAPLAHNSSQARDQSRPDAWSGLGDIHLFDEQYLAQEHISDSSQVDPAHRREDRGRGRSASSPPSTTNSLLPFEIATPTVDDLAAHAEQERRHQRLEGAFARLFLESQGERQQENHGRGGYPNVQVHQPISQAQQDAISRQQQQQQQQQIPQVQQSTFPLQQQQQPRPFSNTQYETCLRRLLEQRQQQRQYQQFLQAKRAGLPQHQSIGLHQQQQHQLPQVQPNVYPRQQHDHPSQVQQNAFPQQHGHQQLPQVQHAVMPQQQQQQQQQNPIHQPQQVVVHQQQRQNSFRGQRGVSPQHQQQQQPQPPVEVQPGLYIVYDPATQGYKYACEPLQSHGNGGNQLPGVTKSSKDPSKPSEAVSHPTIPMVKRQSPAKEDEHEDQRGEQKQTSTVNESRDPQNSSSAIVSPPRDTFFSRFGGDYSDATPETAAKKVVEALLRQRHELNTSSSGDLDTVEALNEDDTEGDVGQGFEFHSTDERGMKAPDPMELEPSVTADTLPASHSVASVFLEARERLKRLQADIEDLSDSSDDSAESSGSGSEVTILSGQHGDHTTNNVGEETGAGGSGPQDLRKSSEETASSSGSSPSQKRSQLEDTNEDRTRAEIGASRKRTKHSNLRFICCFHDGPGRKCSGTDETISDVLKKLSEQHDTHVCGGCWVLKVIDESSGLFVHPNNGQACVDHCLSPQCHKTTPIIGNRHMFDQTTCGTKTSRVRPGDSEAVYRYIFSLIHPELDCPSSVLTAEHSLHLDVVPRQSRRKLNREELTARANDLENRLEAGEKQNLANANRITQLQQELAEAHRATRAAEEKNAALEKQTRRIIAMLSDALRTGLFMDLDAHQSLLRRVEEDAPGALVHQSSLLTPSPSDGSRNSSTALVRVDVAAQGSDQFSRPVGPAAQESAAARTVPPGAMPRDRTMDEYMSDAWNAEPAWLDIFDDPGESDNAINLQGNRW